MPAGRPSKYDPTFAVEAEKLCKLGATDAEIVDFFDLKPSHDEWLAACLMLIRQDRLGFLQARKKARSKQRKRWFARNPSMRVRNSISSRMWAAIKGSTDGRLFSRLGYSADQLTDHLEWLFAPGMSWENYGKWHIDHIKPCAAFDLTDQVQFSECWALENLQPLWAGENCRKGARYGAA